MRRTIHTIQSIPSDNLVKLIEDGLKEGINLLVSGQEFISSFQKDQYEKIIKLRKRNRNLRIVHLPQYQNIFLIVDGEKGIISSYEKYKLNLGTSGYSVLNMDILLPAIK